MKEFLYNGFLKIFRREHEGQQYEVMDRGDAASVLIVQRGKCVEEDLFYLGRQYRAGANRVIFTAVAGMIDVGEKPMDAAIREAMEEAGAMGHITPLGWGYTSAGGCTEITYQHVMVSPTFTTPTDPSEGIKWKWHNYGTVMQILQGNGFASMQLNNAILSYIYNRDRIPNYI